LNSIACKKKLPSLQDTLTNDYSTQSIPSLPTQPLFLSPDEIRVCYDIDKHGIDMASKASLEKLGFLATRLTTEVINFTKHYPALTPAGLVLNVDVLLPVWEPVGTALESVHKRFMALSEEDRGV